MKKLSLVVILVFTSILAANAQLFVGGSISTNSNGGKSKITPTTGAATSTDNPTNLNLTISPTVGKFLSEKMAVGASINFGSNTWDSKGATPTISKSTTIGITPFMRYYVSNTDKFSVFATTGLGLSSTSGKTTSSGTTVDDPKVSSLALTVRPAVSYKLSDKIILETGLNFLNLGYYRNTQVTETTGVGTDKSTSSSFNLGVNSSVVNLGSITVTAIVVL